MLHPPSERTPLNKGHARHRTAKRSAWQNCPQLNRRCMILIGGQVLLLCLVLLVSCYGRAPKEVKRGGDPISSSRSDNDLSLLVNIDGAPPRLHRDFSPRSENDKDDNGSVEKDVGVRIAFVGNSMFYFNGKENFHKSRVSIRSTRWRNSVKLFAAKQTFPAFSKHLPVKIWSCTKTLAYTEEQVSPRF